MEQETRAVKGDVYPWFWYNDGVILPKQQATQSLAICDSDGKIGLTVSWGTGLMISQYKGMNEETPIQ